MPENSPEPSNTYTRPSNVTLKHAEHADFELLRPVTSSYFGVTSLACTYFQRSPQQFRTVPTLPGPQRVPLHFSSAAWRPVHTVKVKQVGRVFTFVVIGLCHHGHSAVWQNHGRFFVAAAGAAPAAASVSASDTGKTRPPQHLPIRDTVRVSNIAARRGVCIRS